MCKPRKALLLSLVVLTVSTLSNGSYEFPLFSGTFEKVLAQQVGGNSLFPNATTAIPGNQSIIPGLHVMSLVNGVKLTWIIISSDNELSVNLRYIGNGTTPPVSLLATALKTPFDGQTLSGQNASNYQRLEGSNTTSTGWVSPATIPIKVEGGMSLYDSDLIIVMVVPYTAPQVTNSSTNVTQ